MKTLIGISTYGNLPFTQLTINSIRATTKAPIDFFVVVGKPSDTETAEWLASHRIAHVRHDGRHGFPVGLNDMMDYAWNKIPGLLHAGSYQNLIIAGNDIVAYPNAVDALIEEAARGEWEWICSSQFDAKSLVARYPEAQACFTGDSLNFERWTAMRKSAGIGEAEVIEYTPSAEPWNLHKDFHAPSIQPDCIKDVRNLCLFTRSVFEKIGYADVNFWPGGYFEDNDACYRARLAGVRACGLAHSAYFHFWSRTIHQVLGEAGVSAHHRQFSRNAAYYERKWGGAFDREKYTLPFNGRGHGHRNITFSDGRVKIDSRAEEQKIVSYWIGVHDGVTTPI